jgi:ribonuclease HI
MFSFFIVHALALLKQQNSKIPVYSDSVNAIKWVKNKKCNTKLKPTEKNTYIFDLISRAEKWLTENDYPNTVIKWETDKWGEIPADFGRK